MLPVAILAGGLATRLRPITEKIPKSLVEVAGRPFIFWQLEWLRDQGVKQVVLCIGHLGDQLIEAVGTGERFGLSITYSKDGPELLGTGGALRRAIPLLGNSFFVLYGDSYLRCSLASVERAFSMSGMPALMTVLRNQGRWDNSNVIFRDGRIVCYDKKLKCIDMEYIDYGVSILDVDVLLSQPEGGYVDLADVLKKLVERGLLAGLEVSERFYEIGSATGLGETERFLLEMGKS